MKKSIAAFVISLVVFSLGSAPIHSASSGVMLEDCSCSAPDGSCSVSISCSGGCSKFCGNNDNCRAFCSGFYAYFGTELTIEMQNSSYGQLVAELARISGKELAFSPLKPNMVFNVGFKKATLWDGLMLLSDQGAVRIAGEDFEKLRSLRRSLLLGERFSFCVKRTPVSTFVNDMTGLTGLPLRMVAGNPMATVNIQLQDVTLSEMLTAVSDQSGTKIIVERAELGAK